MAAAAAAKLLKTIIDKEQPKLFILGNGRSTGQMLLALLGWPQSTFTSKISPGADAIEVARASTAGLRL